MTNTTTSDPMCSQCGKPKEDLTKKMCEVCRKKRRERAARLEEKRKKKDLCVKCGAKLDRDGVTCSKCLRKKRGKKDPDYFWKCMGCQTDLRSHPETLKHYSIPGENEEEFTSLLKEWNSKTKEVVSKDGSETELSNRLQDLLATKSELLDLIKKDKVYCDSCYHSRMYAFHLIDKYLIGGLGGKCFCCGEERSEFLKWTTKHSLTKTIHHDEFELDGSYGTFTDLLRFDLLTGIKNNGDEITISCINCLLAIHRYGKCPHKTTDVFENKPIIAKKVIKYANKKVRKYDELLLDVLHAVIEDLKKREELSNKLGEEK